MTATHFLVEAARNLKAKIAKKDEAMIAELEAQIAHIGLYRNAWAYLELREARQWVAALEANDAKRTRGRVTRLVGGLAQFLRGWFNMPVVYNNNRRAILAMEKGTSGERAFADAFKTCSNAQDDADLLKSSILVGQRSFQRSLQPS